MVERQNQTLQEKTRSMMLESGLPGSLWDELMLTANVLRNMTPTALRNKTPIELWTGRKPFVERFRKIGLQGLLPNPEAIQGEESLRL